MTLEEAKKILKDQIEESGLYGSINYIDWTKGDKKITLDGHFTSEQLEAMAVYMKEIK